MAGMLGWSILAIALLVAGEALLVHGASAFVWSAISDYLARQEERRRYALYEAAERQIKQRVQVSDGQICDLGMRAYLHLRIPEIQRITCQECCKKLEKELLKVWERSQKQ